jgi:hypothetical protein
MPFIRRRVCHSEIPELFAKGLERDLVFSAFCSALASNEVMDEKRKSAAAKVAQTPDASHSQSLVLEY